MNTRERFNKVMHWQKPDKVPNMDFGYWHQTVEVWHKQGLPENVKTDSDVEKYLGLEGTSIMPGLPLWNGLCPGFEYKVIEDKGNHEIVRDSEGNICEKPKIDSSMPKYIKFGLETKDDWERYKKEQLDYKNEKRIGDVKKTVSEAHDSGMPVIIYCGSLYGWLRNWMGLENFSIAIMTEREWVIEMIEHLTQMTLYLIEKSLPRVKGEVDVAWWWEDMCYNHGPLVSPVFFEEIMVPRYRLITETLKKYGVDVNVLDCDGQIYKLVGGWLKSGINCMFPIEAAHTDPLRLREEYGRNILLIGGVNKIQLAKGKEAIDREMERLHPLVEKGGYIPTVDHRVPPDVSFENYLYYLKKKQEIL